MLSPEQMLAEWLRAAEARGLESTVVPEDDGTLRTLSMKGPVGDTGVTLLYGPAGDHDGPVTLRADGTTEGVFALEARGAVKHPRSGRLSVRQDPTPTLRKVASWIGRGDPEVGDKEFDDVFLIEAEAALARDVLVPDARDALKELARLGVPLVLVVERDLATLTCRGVEKAEPTLDAAIRALVAVCG
jgi:hypothetical protein